MAIDLRKIEKVLEMGDKIIEERPELLSMPIDDIFEEFNEDIEDNISVRWGIMARAKMKEIESYSPRVVFDFLMQIENHDLLCDYIGYILQKEHSVSLLDILFLAYEEKKHVDILPFVVSLLNNEQSTQIDKIDMILDIIDSSDEIWKNKVVKGYGLLVLKMRQEETLFELYFSMHSDALEFLIKFVSGELWSNNQMCMKRWIERCMNETSVDCKKMGIYILERGLYFSEDTFGKYFELLEGLWGEKECRDCLITLYIEYLDKKDNKKLRSKVVKRLTDLRQGSIPEKRLFLNSIFYRIDKTEEYQEIWSNIIETSFEKDSQILKLSDRFFCCLIDKDIVNAINIIFKVYEINNYSSVDNFLNQLSLSCKKLKSRQEEIMEIWWDNFFGGSKARFILSIEFLSNIITCDKLKSFFTEIELSDEQAKIFLDGVLLFSFDVNLIIELIFIVAACKIDIELMLNYCIESILLNYPSTLYHKAKIYVDCESESKKVLAKKIVEVCEKITKQKEEALAYKELIPSMERRMIYQKKQYEQREKIKERADEKSFFAKLFPKRKMKYGKSFAYIQTNGNGEYTYLVSEFTKFSHSVELPIYFINNPINYRYMRSEYLERREGYAINS